MISLLLAACNEQTDQPITIASHVWPGYETMFLAQSEGWFDSKQVHLLETKSATDSIQALADGRVDGAALTLDEVLQARARGIPLSVVMIFDISAGADMLLARSDIKTLAGLKGKRIGVEQGAVGGLMLSEILKKAALKPQDIEMVPLTIDQQKDAWMANRIDAVITYEPVASQLLDRDAHKLFDSRQIPNTIVDVLAMRSEALDRSHAAAIRQLLAAHFRVLDHLNRNPYDAVYRMAGRLNLPADEVLSAFKGLLLPDADNNRRLLTGARPPLLATAQMLSTVMVENSLLPRPDPLATIIRAEYLPAAAQ